MSFEYDVAIVGAGPVGSTVAYYLLKKNLNVVILEKKTQIGYPLQCAGILSTHINELNELPEDLILNKVKGAFLHSNNNRLKVQKDEDVAYIIDRIAYDNFLLKRALDSGLKLINKKATDFDIAEGIVNLDNGEKIKSKVIVGCDGYSSLLSKSMGNNQETFNASQYLVNIKNIEEFRKSDKNNNDYVDTFIKKDFLPGFIWVIPLMEDLYRVGLFSEDSHKTQNLYLKEFLDKYFTYEIKEKYKGFIPIFNQKNNLVLNRALLIGDAAGQIKPTSGGGLLIGFDACRIASEYIEKSVRKDDVNILLGYQKEFHKKYLKEIGYQFNVQKTLNILNDDDLDYLFSKLKENDCEKIISQYGDMDKQSVLVKEFIKRGLILKIIPSFFIKKVSKIFGFG